MGRCQLQEGISGKGEVVIIFREQEIGNRKEAGGRKQEVRKGQE
jgi:hypothetical protein